MCRVASGTAYQLFPAIRHLVCSQLKTVITNKSWMGGLRYRENFYVGAIVL